MIYGNGVNAELIGSATSLTSGDVIITYDDLTFSGYYSNQPAPTDIPYQNYNKTRRISRNSQSLDVIASAVQADDVLIDINPTFRVTAVDVNHRTTTYNYFSTVDIVRDNVSMTISADDLRPNDHLLTSDPYILITSTKNASVPSPIYEILVSNSGFHTPVSAENAVYVARTVKFSPDKTDWRNVVGKWETMSLDPGATYKEYDQLTMNDFIGPWGYASKPHHYLYNCMNWWEFTNPPTDISQVPSAHIDKINSVYGGYSKVLASADITTRCEFLKIKNKGVEIEENVVAYGNHFTIKKSPEMPTKMGTTMLFSASDTFNSEKFVGIGYNGLRSDDMGSSADIAFKLYRFTPDDGYFKSIGNNYYIFNDNDMVTVKGSIGVNTRSPYTYGYYGPFFVTAGLSAGTFTDSNKTTRNPALEISPSQFIQNPYVVTSISYMSQGMPESPISGKPINWMYFTNSSSAQYHLKPWDDVENNISYYSFIPYAPGIPLCIDNNASLQLRDTVEEVEFGGDMTAMGSITWASRLTNLKKINGSWKYCNNLTVFGYPSVSDYLFSGATALTTIPSSWEGLDNVNLIRIDNMFHGCTALTAVPETFKHFTNGTTITAMNSCFYDCTKLTKALTSWENLDNVTTAASMFYNCVSLESIPDNFEHLGNLLGCQSMFYNCYKLKEVKSWEGINRINDGSTMFSNCSSLSAIPATWDGINSKFYAPAMFQNCYSLKTIPAAEEWEKLFRRLIVNGYPYNCSNSELLNIPSIFNGCSGIQGTVKEILDVFIEYSVPGQGQFYGCTGFTDYEECHSSQTYAPYL